MGRLFLEQLDGSRVYACKYCACPLAAAEDLISKSFHSRAGKAYLFDSIVNVTVGRSEERLMTTGLHIVVDINCASCCSLLGWKYEFARETSQKYKEGKFILERCKMEVMLPVDQVSENSSENQSQDESEWGQQDSDSEDACI